MKQYLVPVIARVVLTGWVAVEANDRDEAETLVDGMTQYDLRAAAELTIDDFEEPITVNHDELILVGDGEA